MLYYYYYGNKRLFVIYSNIYLGKVNLPWPFPRWKARARIEESMENSFYLIYCTQDR